LVFWDVKQHIDLFALNLANLNFEICRWWCSSAKINKKELKSRIFFTFQQSQIVISAHAFHEEWINRQLNRWENERVLKKCKVLSCVQVYWLLSHITISITDDWSWFSLSLRVVWSFLLRQQIVIERPVEPKWIDCLRLWLSSLHFRLSFHC